MFFCVKVCFVWKLCKGLLCVESVSRFLCVKVFLCKSVLSVKVSLCTFFCVGVSLCESLLCVKVSLCQISWTVSTSTAPQQERFDMHKMPEGFPRKSKNEHTHNESDLTRPRNESVARTISKIHNEQQREWSDTHKTTKKIAQKVSKPPFRARPVLKTERKKGLCCAL